MMDEIFDRQYQAGRADLNAGLDRLFGSVSRELGKSMAALHRVEWSAPWVRSKDNSKKRAGLA